MAMGLNHQHQPHNQITTTTKTGVTSTNLMSVLIGPALSKLKTRDICERGAKGYCTWTKDVVDLGGKTGWLS